MNLGFIQLGKSDAGIKGYQKIIETKLVPIVD
jgi:hypothetical protein